MHSHVVISVDVPGNHAEAEAIRHVEVHADIDRKRPASHQAYSGKSILDLEILRSISEHIQKSVLADSLGIGQIIEADSRAYIKGEVHRQLKPMPESKDGNCVCLADQLCIHTANFRICMERSIREYAQGKTIRSE